MIALLFAAAVALVPPSMPDPAKTPGVVRTDLTVQAICATKWGKDERHVTAAMKAQVFREYGFVGPHDPAFKPDAAGRTVEVDHLISRELAGADEVANLWPEARATQPFNADLKDRIENRLHVEVCAGRMKLEDAQQMMRTDWTAAYVKLLGAPG